jgi:hypothetical protein
MRCKVFNDSIWGILNSPDLMELLHFKSDKVGNAKIAYFNELSLARREPLQI